MKVLIIDNYDSFTYNLYQLVGELLEASGDAFDLQVIKNDEMRLEEIRELRSDRIIISPGPGDPTDAEYFGVCAEVIKTLGQTVPTLGVCLGMQGMAAVFGGSIVRATNPMHGKTSPLTHDGKEVFQNLPQGIEVMRYHSLVVDPQSVPDCLTVSATAGEEIMGLRHTEYPIEGVQFHPESFASEGGRQMLAQFLAQ